MLQVPCVCHSVSLIMKIKWKLEKGFLCSFHFNVLRVQQCKKTIKDSEVSQCNENVSLSRPIFLHAHLTQWKVVVLHLQKIDVSG